MRAGLVVWGGWLVVTALTFSLMAGIFHAYYTVALAPAVGALVGIGATLLWRRRESYLAAIVMAGTVSFTTAFAFLLLDRSPDFVPWLKWARGGARVLLRADARRGAAPAAQGRRWSSRRPPCSRDWPAPTAYSLSTAATPHTGSIPTAGPNSGGRSRRAGRPRAPGGPARTMPPWRQPATQGSAAPAPGRCSTGSQSSAAITTLLQADASSYTWAAAAVGSNSAAGYQLASEEPVMPIGGFNGSDPSPTLAQFKAYVAAGRIHYFIAGGGGGGAEAGGRMSAGGSTSASISSWVTSTFTATTVDGVTLYDLSTGAR